MMNWCSACVRRSAMSWVINRRGTVTSTSTETVPDWDDAARTRGVVAVSTCTHTPTSKTVLLREASPPHICRLYKSDSRPTLSTSVSSRGWDNLIWVKPVRRRQRFVIFQINFYVQDHCHTVVWPVL